MKQKHILGRMLALASIILPLANISCQRRDMDGAWHADERLKVELEQHFKLLTYRFESRGGNLATELQDTRDRIESNRAAIGSAREDLARLETEVSELAVETRRIADEVARDTRRKSIGRHFDTFIAANGRTYRDVTVSQVTDGSVEIRHETGSARFRPADLSLEQQEMFGISAEAAAREARIESERRLAYERHIREHQLEEEASAEIAAARTRARSTRSSHSTALAAADRRDSERPLAQPARSFGSGSIYRSQRTSYRTRYYYAYPSCPSPYRTPYVPTSAAPMLRQRPTLPR
ncbi:MAG: hypothetical protein KDN05_05605 [Verrucomicrobiae bacterium]|nr:hypothetical protein [Verrucomicrobiae bacterium]MCP5532488.1 hypothetical protein [Akkermansiaceae bacterium]MCP5545753.1 hypothetical protein [Akkermansiaceae bacterium]